MSPVHPATNTSPVSGCSVVFQCLDDPSSWDLSRKHNMSAFLFKEQGFHFPGTFQTGSFPPSCWPATFLPIQHASITVLLLGFRCRALSLEWVPKSMTNSTVAHLSLQCHFPLLNHIFVGFLNSGQLRARIQSKKNPITLAAARPTWSRSDEGKMNEDMMKKWPLALTSHLPYILTCLIFWQHPISTCPPTTFIQCVFQCLLRPYLNVCIFTQIPLAPHVCLRILGQYPWGGNTPITLTNNFWQVPAHSRFQ